jgi:uncharacterized protein YegP (UPF0339 family)
MAAQVQTYRSKATTREGKRQQHRWRVKAQNGNKLANGGEGYNNEVDMIAAMRSTHAAIGEFLATVDG